MTSFEDEDEGYQEYGNTLSILNVLYQVYIPVMVVLGVVGNSLSFVAFTFTPLKCRASSYYLGALAISDSAYLCLLLYAWAERIGIKIAATLVRCGVLLFLTSLFSCWSVWLTVSFTAERFLAVCYPLWRLQLSTRRRARTTVCATAILSALLYVYIFVVIDLSSNEQECQMRDQYHELMHYMNIMDTVVTLIVPFILIACMNFRIGRVLYTFYSAHKKSRKSSLNDEEGVDASAKKLVNSSSVTEVTTTVHMDPATLHPNQIGISRMLFLVCSVFIILNTPSYVLRIVLFLQTMHEERPLSPLVVILHKFLMLLYYTNFAINFLLYNLSSKIFRRTVCAYLRGRWSNAKDTIFSLVPPLLSVQLLTLQ